MSSKDESAAGGGGARGGNKGGRSSAPVAIPAGSSSSARGGSNSRGDEKDDAGEMLPPHEWLSRKMKRMGGVASSSPDQAERSKGRELTKVRDAVLRLL
jgi:hypothetical protein